MSVVIATVSGITGKFFAKDADGDIVTLKNGDNITQDMVVYGDKSNPQSANIEIAMIDGGKVITVDATAKQLFDSSLVDGPSTEEGLAKDSVNDALDSSIYADGTEADNKETAASDETAAPDETAAGDQTPTGHSNADTFNARDAGSVDINSGLRDAPFNGVNTTSTTPAATGVSPVANADTAVATEDGHEFVLGEDEPNDGQRAIGNLLANDLTSTPTFVTSVTIDGVAHAVPTDGTNATIVSTYGTFSVNNSGAYTYTVNDVNPTVNALNIGDNIPVNIAYSISDGAHAPASSSLAITIEGRDDAPVIGTITSQTLTSVTTTTLFSEGFGGIAADATLDTETNNTGDHWYVNHGNGTTNALHTGVTTTDAFGNTTNLTDGVSGANHTANTWTMNGAGVEMRTNHGVHGLATADGSDHYVELDANTNGLNSSITTSVGLGGNDLFTLTFNYIPRPGSVDSSDMEFSFGGPEHSVAINADANNNLTYVTNDSNIAVYIVSAANGWSTVTATFSGITGTSADLNFQSTGVADTLGAYIDNINVVGTDYSSQTFLHNIASLTDVDNTTLSSATVTLTNYQAGDLLIANTLSGGITATVSQETVNGAVTDVMHLSGTASVSDYKASLEALSFGTTSHDTTSRHFDVTVNDGVKTSNTESVDFTPPANTTPTSGTGLNGTTPSQDGTAGDDTITTDGNVPIDAGAGHDTILLDTHVNLTPGINFSNLQNIETIDLTHNGDHTISNLTLSDVVNMTDNNNDLVIKGDSGDTLNLSSVADNPATATNEAQTWSTTSTANDGHADVYVNSADSSVSITVDEQIIVTGI